MVNLGISTSYFAARGFSIYESVARAYRLGFRLIELGANHNFEEHVFETLKKIRRDFPDVLFTQHCYFPPVFPINFMANPAQGLTKENKQVINAMVEAAGGLGTKIISAHAGFNAEFTFTGKSEKWHGFNEFSSTALIPREIAYNNVKEFFTYLINKTQKMEIKIAVENVVSRSEYPSTLFDYDDFKLLLETIPGLNFLLDFGHSFLSQKDPYRFFYFKEKIIEMHLGGVDKSRVDHRVLGTGILDLDKLFSEIKRLPRMPFLILEHSAEVKEQEILEEVKSVEKYLGSC